MFFISHNSFGIETTDGRFVYIHMSMSVCSKIHIKQFVANRNGDGNEKEGLNYAKM
jgi:hypothetical protein